MVNHITKPPFAAGAREFQANAGQMTPFEKSTCAL